MQRPTRAFTLVELLVTIGIIAVLVGLIVVSMKGLRLSAHRAESLSALRQMMSGYLSYAADHDQRLMPGYIAPDDFLPGEAFEDLDGRIILPNDYRFDLSAIEDREDAGSYVWRLAPYVDGRWEIFCADYGSRGLVSRLQREFDGQNLASVDGDEVYGRGSRGANDIGLGFAPSFGLNSIYLGGDSFHGGGPVTDLSPWNPADPSRVIAAERLSQVKNPAKIITFAANFQGNESLRPPDVTGSEIQYGYPTLRPPLVALDATTINPDPETWPAGPDQYAQWAYQPGSLEPVVTDGDDGNGIGLPVGRWGAEQVPTCTLDGATAIENPLALARDISRWHWDFTFVVSSGQ
ncbi:MAG: type II secretion system protein [Planctomycetota bacterium]|jgi:prepilin-type N-terminal cleavage/methylation domain-containing protein